MLKKSKDTVKETIALMLIVLIAVTILPVAVVNEKDKYNIMWKIVTVLAGVVLTCLVVLVLIMLTAVMCQASKGARPPEIQFDTYINRSHLDWDRRLLLNPERTLLLKNVVTDEGPVKIWICNDANCPEGCNLLPALP